MSFPNGGKWLLFKLFDLWNLKSCSVVLINSTQHVQEYQMVIKDSPTRARTQGRIFSSCFLWYCLYLPLEMCLKSHLADGDCLVWTIQSIQVGYIALSVVLLAEKKSFLLQCFADVIFLSNCQHAKARGNHTFEHSVWPKFFLLSNNSNNNNNSL